MREKSGSAIHAYNDFLKLGYNSDPPYIIDLTYEEWCSKGYTLFAFDLTHSKDSGGISSGVVNPTTTSNVHIHIKFGVPTPTPLTCYIYSLFDNKLEITNNRQVTFNFNG